MSAVGSAYRHLKRYRQILGTMMAYGFGEFVQRLHPGEKFEWMNPLGFTLNGADGSAPERMRRALSDLGPTFIKLGQILSTRPDLLPPEYIYELRKLQDEVPPFAFAEVRRIVEEELRRPLEEVFEFVHEEPLAAASIAQVHRARLHTGEEVVFKVQRPEVRQMILVDTEIMMRLAALIERRFEAWQHHRPGTIAGEFSEALRNELDFTVELAHMERFAHDFQDDPAIHIPRTHREFSTSRVLVMEFVRGVKIGEMDNLLAAGLNPRLLGRRGADSIMKQILVNGFFHADPHPGNFIVMPDNVICFLDFGQVGRLSLEQRRTFADLAWAVSRRDADRASRGLLRLCVYDDEAFDQRRFHNDVAQILEQHFYQPLKNLDFTKLLHQILDTTRRNRLSLMPEIFLMLKAFATVHSLAKSLDPEFDIGRRVAPYVRRLKLARANPKQFSWELLDAGGEFASLLRDAPGEARHILATLRRGKLKLDFEHKGLEELSNTLDRVSNRVSYAVALGSLIIGSSVVVHSRIPPMWKGIPVIGLAGFLMAGFLAFGLLISILRRGRM